MGQRETRQKKAIGQAIANLRFLFNAETLYKEVLKSNTGVGIATVYRFLKSLADEGKIHAYSCNRQMIYSTSTVSHCHFTCENCGEARHIKLKTLDFLQGEVKGSVCHFQIDVTGLCQNCKEKSESIK